jgi:uncharacterized OB-fold protein
MTEGLVIHVCRRCGYNAFPPRYFCPNCGGARWRRDLVTQGIVEERTILRHIPGVSEDSAILIAAVRVDAGPIIIARLICDVPQGTSVNVSTRGGVPFVHQEQELTKPNAPLP